MKTLAELRASLEKEVKPQRGVEEKVEIETRIEPISQSDEDFTKPQLSTINITKTAPPKIILNDKQAEANQLALTGKSFCLIGAAGTGKTTTIQYTTAQLLTLPHIPKINSGTKYLHPGVPGIAILSYTRKAVNNIRRKVVQELKPHTLTIHKLLEFAPIKYEIEDKETGLFKLTMRFEPQRNKDNPLPKELKLIIWEESSMIGTELYNQFREACQHEIQEIFLGDIQQLTPIFGSAALGFKMLELHTVELTEVYRQALESPIISLAWDILRGDAGKFNSKIIKKRLPGYERERNVCEALDRYETNNEHGSLKFQYWQFPVKETLALQATVFAFKNWHSEGYYNEKEDIILCPFNKSFGTIEINRHLGQYFSIMRSSPTHEIIVGFEKVYWAEGDRVLYDKEDAFIESIIPNPAYMGKTSPNPPSVYLDRWGIQQSGLTEEEMSAARLSDEIKGDQQVDYFLEGDASLNEIDERVNQASHIVSIKFSHSDEVISLTKVSEIRETSLLGGYCITIHKAQGSEWEKVFLWLHYTHIKMCQRELLYTAVTRARKHLHIMCETTTFEKGVKSQKIKGNTLREKALVFEGKIRDGDEDAIPWKSKDLVISEILQRLQKTQPTNLIEVEDTPRNVQGTAQQQMPTSQDKLKQAMDRLKARITTQQQAQKGV